MNMVYLFLSDGGGRERPSSVAQPVTPHSGDTERHIPRGAEILGVKRPPGGGSDSCILFD